MMLREPLDPQTSSRYLWLGVFAQRIVDQLTRGGSDSNLHKSLVDSIEALKRIESGNVDVDAVLPFQDYEQVSTLFDVIAPDNREMLQSKLGEFRETLEKLVEKFNERDTKLADESATVFRKIASEALRRSKLPPEGLSRRALELCQKP